MSDLILPLTNAAPADAAPITYPALNFTIGPDGMLITIALAPGFHQQLVVAPATLVDICKKWREVQRAQAGMQQIALDVMRTKH